MDNGYSKGLFEKSQIGIIQYAILPDFRVTYINEALESILESPKSLLVDKNLFELFNGKLEGEYNLTELFTKAEKNDFELKVISQISGYRWYNVKVFSQEENIFVAQLIDITRQKAELKELIYKDEILSHIIDSTNAGTWEWNVKTGEQRINSRWAEMLGYSLDELEPISIDTFRHLCHPDDFNLVMQRFNTAKKGELNYFEIRFRMLSKDSKWRWISSRGIVTIWDDKDRPVLISGTHIDITHLIEMEKDKIANEEYYKRIINSTKDMIIILDSDGNISLWNKSAEEILGYTQEEVLGKNVHLLIAGKEHLENYKRGFAGFKDKGKGRFTNQITELEAITKGGNKIPIELSMSVVNTDKGYTAIGIMRDITKRKEAERVVKEGKERLSLAQRMAHVGHWEFDIKSKNILASMEARKIYGLDEDVKFYSIEEIRGCARTEYQPVLEKLLKGLIEREEEYDIEFAIEKKSSGEERFVHSIGILIRDEEGRPTKVRGTIQDITERKRKENEIIYLSYYDQLTGLYNRRFFEEELKRLDTKRNLPITIILGDVNGLKLINDSFGHSSGDEYLKSIARILKKSCRADDIISRLGGDEFTIILPGTDEFEAKKILDRIGDNSKDEKICAVNVSIAFGLSTKHNENEKMEEIIKVAEDRMYKNKLYESKGSRSNTINIIMNTLYEKNEREMLHSKRVGDLSKLIAKEMGLSNEEINKVYIAGLMHDIGKIGIDENILNWTGKLNDAEWEQIKKHSEIGYRILSSSAEFSEISQYALEHHERWDGRGYPKGLRGDEISLLARIISVADAYDAMTAERPYRRSLSHDKAVEEIVACAGSQFDPDIAIASKRALKKPIGI